MTRLKCIIQLDTRHLLFRNRKQLSEHIQYWLVPFLIFRVLKKIKLLLF